MKKISLLFMSLIFMISISTSAFGSNTTLGNNPNIEITIISPMGVQDFPGHEDIITAKVTNQGSEDLSQLLAYVTMADLNKNMTVNLEDYGADKPLYIESLKAGQSQTIELPIRFVYTSKYHLYVTVVTKDSHTISSSKAITIEILGNTKINKPLALGVSVIEPILILVLVGIIYGIRRKKYRVKRA